MIMVSLDLEDWAESDAYFDGYPKQRERERERERERKRERERGLFTYYKQYFIFLGSTVYINKNACHLPWLPVPNIIMLASCREHATFGAILHILHCIYIHSIIYNKYCLIV